MGLNEIIGSCVTIKKEEIPFEINFCEVPRKDLRNAWEEEVRPNLEKLVKSKVKSVKLQGLVIYGSFVEAVRKPGRLERILRLFKRTPLYVGDVDIAVVIKDKFGSDEKLREEISKLGSSVKQCFNPMKPLEPDMHILQPYFSLPKDRICFGEVPYEEGVNLNKVLFGLVSGYISLLVLFNKYVLLSLAHQKLSNEVSSDEVRTIEKEKAIVREAMSYVEYKIKQRLDLFGKLCKTLGNLLKNYKGEEREKLVGEHEKWESIYKVVKEIVRTYVDSKKPRKIINYIRILLSEIKVNEREVEIFLFNGVVHYRNNDGNNSYKLFVTYKTKSGIISEEVKSDNTKIYNSSVIFSVAHGISRDMKIVKVITK